MQISWQQEEGIISNMYKKLTIYAIGRQHFVCLYSASWELPLLRNVQADWRPIITNTIKRNILYSWVILWCLLMQNNLNYVFREYKTLLSNSLLVDCEDILWRTITVLREMFIERDGNSGNQLRFWSSWWWHTLITVDVSCNADCRKMIFQVAVQIYKDQDIQKYNFACCFVWMWNLVADIVGRT